MAFQFKNHRHKHIYEKLQFIGPGPAAFFEDAVKLIFDDNYTLKSEVHLISHIFREIESAVRDAIRLPEEKKDSHKKDINYILEKLDIPPDHPVGEAWIQFTNQDFDLQFNKLVHRNSLLSPRQRQQEIEDSWEDFMDILDLVIDKAQQNYFNAVDTIDKLLEKKHPTEADAQILASNIPINDTTLSYLFDQCDNSDWISLLRDKGFFQHPPPTIYNDDGSWRYPAWPAGKLSKKWRRKNQPKSQKLFRRFPIQII